MLSPEELERIAFEAMEKFKRERDEMGCSRKDCRAGVMKAGGSSVDTKKAFDIAVRACDASGEPYSIAPFT